MSAPLKRQDFEKIVIVTRETALDGLLERFQVRGQAKFYLEHAGQDYEAVETVHEQYQEAVLAVRRQVPKKLKVQVIDRAFLPQFLFAPTDIVVTVGQDGLVANVAKYLEGQPIVAVNPDPKHIDGVLLPVAVDQVSEVVQAVIKGRATYKMMTMAQALLNDGQTLRAVNDVFIGAQNHVSARYRLQAGGELEEQSSSGIIISTGVGSTGWLQSIYAEAAGVVTACGGHWPDLPHDGRLPWNTDRLVYAVREPFPSKTTGTSLVFGQVTQAQPLVVTSLMSEGGVIFSDGIQKDYLPFNRGSEVTVGIAPHQTYLAVV